MKPSSNQQLLDQLRDQIQYLERSERRSPKELVCSTGLAELDRLFPDGGLAAGTLTEWLSKEEGSGAATLALFLAARLQERGGVVVVLDDRREFYPPAATALGMALEQTVVIQTRQPREALWAWEQVLRSTAVAAVLGWMDKLNDRTFRRLQLAAETGGGLGFLLRPFSCRDEPSWAEARFLVEGVPSDGPLSSLGRRLRVGLLHGRGGRGGENNLELELSDETGVVRLAAAVAHSAAAARASRA